MPLWEDIGIESYQEYLDSDHWQNLKKTHIYSNAKVCCFICNHDYKQSGSYLLIHHINYKSLGSEKPLFLWFGDFVIVCDKCHEKLHFWNILGIWKVKIPLIRNLLLRRVYQLRMNYSIRKGKIIPAISNFCMLALSW